MLLSAFQALSKEVVGLFQGEATSQVSYRPLRAIVSEHVLRCICASSVSKRKNIFFWGEEDVRQAIFLFFEGKMLQEDRRVIFEGK